MHSSLGCELQVPVTFSDPAMRLPVMASAFAFHQARFEIHQARFEMPVRSVGPVDKVHIETQLETLFAREPGMFLNEGVRLERSRGMGCRPVRRSWNR